MAGFETVVRPVIFPDIRPARPRPVAQKDDPDSGKCVISGAGGKIIDLPFSYSVSTQRPSADETERTVDVVRVYKKEDAGNGNGAASRAGDGGTVDKDTFIDVEVIKRVWLMDGEGMNSRYKYAPIEEADNIEIIKRDVTKRS